ncbi:unannotated protein [freshwater metagenome]|uniref:Unannotated protein n=1 Tax=freshwater metagenome TaxID=449393 RepID=A0A6J6A0L3_9ZZZZ|nr:hypothetical protein [Actinomycetota bacterium]
MSDRLPIKPGPPAAAKTRLPGIFLVAALILLIAYVTYNTATGERGSSTGPAVGTPMVQFAAPLVNSALVGDVNVTQRSAGATTARAACDLSSPAILNSCQLVKRQPAALVFINSAEGRCADTLDRVIAAAAKYPGIRVAGIVIAGDRAEARRLAASHRWKIPLGEDRDGALANLYGVAVCPQTVYLRAGGVVDAVSVGESDPSALDARLSALIGPN